VGLDAERWTTARFAEAIFAKFSVRYDPDHAGRIMHRLGLREKTRNRSRAQEALQATPFPRRQANLSQAGVA
jgi:transposase